MNGPRFPNKFYKLVLSIVFLTGCASIKSAPTLIPTQPPTSTPALHSTQLPTTSAPTPIPTQLPTALPTEFVWKVAGDPNPLFTPVGIALDQQGNIYVMDAGNSRVQKFDSNGKFILMWGSPGSGDGQFKILDPDDEGLAIDVQGDIYVLDDGNNRVQKFDSNGNFLVQWGTEGTGAGQFIAPTAIAIDKDNNIYVDDWKNNTVQKFDKNGRFLLRWGKAGNKNGEFHLLTSMAIDPQGNLLVAQDDRLQKFDRNGQFLSSISPDPVNNSFIEFWGIAIDSQGNIYVSDHNNQRIVKLDSQGHFLTTWNGTIAGAEAFKGIGRITVDGQGNVFVTDKITNLIQKFRQPGFHSLTEVVEQLFPMPTHRPIATVLSTLTRTKPSLPPAKMSTGAGVVWRLVVVSESSGWGLGEAYASQIEKDVGVRVAVDDFAIGDLSAGDVLDELQAGTSSFPELEGLPAALVNADVVLIFPSPMRSLENDAFLNIQRCFGNLAGTPTPCSSKSFESYTADLEAIWAKVFELRHGKPTILRALDDANPFVSRWNENQVFEPCTACWECGSSAAHHAAEAYHIPFLSRYDIYNGPDHKLDPGKQGYIGADGIHPNGLAQQRTAELLSKFGYEPITP